MVWDYDYPEDEQYIDDVIEIFRRRKAQICLVELSADLEVRLKRNKMEDRLKAKPTKRNLKQSEKSLLDSEKTHRMTSREDEFHDKDILKIDNTHRSAQGVAEMIKSHYDLKC